MINEKRKLRTYKIADKPYKKAKKKAQGSLATLIEYWVKCYGDDEMPSSLFSFTKNQLNHK